MSDAHLLQDPFESFGLDRNSLSPIIEAIKSRRNQGDMAASETIASYIADANEIRKYEDAIFRNCTDGYRQLRMFREGQKKECWGGRVTEDGYQWPAFLVTDREQWIEAARYKASIAALQDQPINVCPPASTFIGPTKATKADICQGAAIMVECDERPSQTRLAIAALLGPATIIVASGGQWTDPDSGHVEDKVHIYWRLKKPSQTGEEHDKLYECNDLAARIVASDPTAKASVHPLRLPGSWHRKRDPKLVHIVEYNPDLEVRLDDILRELRRAAARQNIGVVCSKPSTNGTRYEGIDVPHIENLTRDPNLFDPLIHAKAIFEQYLALPENRHRKLFGTCVSIVMTALNRGYGINTDEILGIAKALQKKNPSNSPYEHSALVNLAKEALADATRNVQNHPLKDWAQQDWQREQEFYTDMSSPNDWEDDNFDNDEEFDNEEDFGFDEMKPENDDDEMPDNEPTSDRPQWGEPINLYGTLTPEPTITKEMLPKVVADFVYEQAALLGCNPGPMAIAALTILSSIVSDNVKLQPKKYEVDYTESARLWMVICGEVSSKKSPMMKKLMQPLKEIAAKMAVEDKHAREVYKRDMEVYEKKKAAWVTASAKNEGSSFAPEEPQKPPRRRLLSNDFTPEALALVLSENPRGFLLELDEIMQLFGGFDSYRQPGAKRDRSLILQLWLGGRREIDRVRSQDEPISVPNWGSSIIGGIQNDKLREIFIKLLDDGLIQRFILVPMGDGVDEVDLPMNPDVQREYQILVDNLIGFNPADSVRIRLSAEANAVRLEMQDIIHSLEVLPGVSNGLRTHAGKMGSIFYRLMLTLHMIIESRNFIDDEFHIISGETAIQARELMVKYLIPHATRQYEYFMADENDHSDNDVRWLAGHILANTRHKLTIRGCQQAARKFKGKGNNRAARAIHTLTETHWLDYQGNVNPQVHVLYVDIAEKERHTRNKTRDRIKKAKVVLKKTFG